MGKGELVGWLVGWLVDGCDAMRLPASPELIHRSFIIRTTTDRQLDR